MADVQKIVNRLLFVVSTYEDVVGRGVAVLSSSCLEMPEF